ncbi:hypothetical protein FBULB1_12037 [Fusarium bulbicola]|nr:hypothetical protein FBULB1_12037 [Fusarium bulbicola]
MPARSTQITIENHTSQDLHGGNGSLVHGIWSEGVPDTIPKGQSGTIHFDNPYAGDNSYNTQVPDHFNISSNGGEGNNCIITYTVTEKLGHGHK